jgi:hypothetical protein
MSYEAKGHNRRRRQAWPDTAYRHPISPCVWKDKQSQSRAAVLEVLIAEKQLQKMHSQMKQSQPPG